ncbi:hypothetical protein ACS0TY_005543 [Phlomoides rotata]
MKLLRLEVCGVSRKLGFNCYFGVDCVVSGAGRRGGLTLLWEEECLLDINSYSNNHIDAVVNSGEAWRFISIYGFPEDNQKWKMWRLIEELKPRCTLPWLCLGDCNEILQDSEKRGEMSEVKFRYMHSVTVLICAALTIWVLLAINLLGQTNRRG